MLAANERFNREPSSEKLSIDYAVGGHIMVAFVSANCPSRLRTHDPIDGSVIIASASEPALHLCNSGGNPISIVIVAVVIVRVVVAVIGIRIEEWKTKRIEEDERPIVETAEMMRARHGP
jgi:hypothetical protein